MRLTDRLRLEPIGPGHARDLLALYQDPAVAEWYGEWTPERVDRECARMAAGWAADGVHKWMAYLRETDTPVGRGGLSRAVVDGASGLELGWVLHRRFWGQGYATEIGRAGLDYAFGDLAADEVVSFTETHNLRSRAVMERLGFHHAKTIQIDNEPYALYRLRGQNDGPPTGSPPGPGPVNRTARSAGPSPG